VISHISIKTIPLYYYQDFSQKKNYGTSSKYVKILHFSKLMLLNLYSHSRKFYGSSPGNPGIFWIFHGR